MAAARTSAFAVANFILDRAREEGIAITHLKLQKLVYFCYAWFAGNLRAELFAEDIEAWQYGPVVRELYLELKGRGSEPITALVQSVDWGSGMFVTPTVDDELAAELTPIWDAYKAKTPAWLVEATHTRDEPWAHVVSKYGHQEKRKIPFDLIERIYASRVERIDA